MSSVLVTGCAGFIGSHLTDSLLGDGHDVVGVDCFTDNYERADKLANLERARDHDRFELRPVDLATADVARLIAGCGVIYHLAAEPGVRASWGSRFERFVRSNVTATQRLLESARDVAGIRVVYASSSSVYGDAERLPTREDATPQPLSPYGVTKLGGEQLCRLYHANFGLHTVALRYFSVYGPRQRPDMAFRGFCGAAIAGEPIVVFGDGRQTRDFTYVADVVAATRAAGEAEGAGGAVYNIGGGARVTLERALELLAGVAGRPLDVRRQSRQSGDARHTGADISRACRELGYSPVTTLEAGLRAEFDWVNGRGRDYSQRYARTAAARRARSSAVAGASTSSVSGSRTTP
jgi:UDP-glucuronate 4-epimerase